MNVLEVKLQLQIKPITNRLFMVDYGEVPENEIGSNFPDCFWPRQNSLYFQLDYTINPDATIYIPALFTGDSSLKRSGKN